jgi:predicted ATP-grasp superfamily ATP-dependent carboligase
MKLAKPIVYVTRDIERALGMEQDEKYIIVSNEKGAPAIDTYDLLQSEKVGKLMEEKKDASILVFQNTPRIERFCMEKSWKLINPSAELSKRIEEKISQYEWLGDLKSYLPPTEVKKMSDIRFAGEPIVVQFNHAHTGQGTKIIFNEKDLVELSEKFPDRPARVSAFIDGPVFTLNAVVARNGIFPANVSYQITGLPDFTDNPFSTIGNDWKLPHEILSEKEMEKIVEIARAVGARMQSAGWLGLFGIDIILEEKSREIRLLEINARQPASTTCESILQKSTGKDMTTFEAHVAALLGEKVSDIQKIFDGAQIVLREEKTARELSRTRSEKGIMESHGRLNAAGEKLRALILKK